MSLTGRLADLVIALCKRLAHTKRVILDRDGAEPYLTRWYLIGTSPAQGGARGKWGLYLHQFNKSDSPEALHNHPWRWAVSLVLKGGYWELREAGNWHWRAPGDFNFLDADTFHRVALDYDEAPAYTLFLVGPRIQGWGFLSRETGKFVPWRVWLDLSPYTPEDV